MSVRRGLLWCCLLWAGSSPLPGRAGDAAVPAQQLWEQGQQALRRGQVDDAIRFYEQSLSADPAFQRSHLNIAAAYLEKNDEAAACHHLGKYLDAYPENLAAQTRYAELLAGLHRFKDAGGAYEAVIAAMQDLPGPVEQGLVTPHTRLVEIAEASADAYGEHLHRGIALWLLARRRAVMADPENDLPAESLLCKAAAELTLASLEQPREARPCLYLYQVWSHLGQQQPALCRLRQAEDAAPFSYLTPAEQRTLHLACQAHRDEPIR